MCHGPDRFPVNLTFRKRLKNKEEGEGWEKDWEGDILVPSEALIVVVTGIYYCILLEASRGAPKLENDKFNIVNAHISISK